MKTTEEKARAYDEVLNKLRHFIAKGVDPLITRADVQDFFPELAEFEDEKAIKEIIELVMQPIWKTEKEFHRRNELCAWIKKQGQVKESFISQHENRICKENDDSLTSEDDRIREALVEMVHDTTGDGLWACYNVHKEEALAWLEKQGEHANFRNKIQVGDKVTRNENGVLVNLSQLKRVAKPADKIEPKFKVGDKIYLKPEYRMPDDDTPIANTVKEIRRIDDKHYRFDGSYIFIEDQDKYELVEQKPIEENKGNIGGISPNWSEEDKGIIEEVVSYLINYSNIVESKEDADRIEYLIDKIQDICPHQKQEWSEEDEQHIDSLLKRLDALCRNKFERTRFAISEDRDWLKSLRPQNRWKPSDEQMEALYKTSKNEYLKADQYDVLLELWNNLKKLKEE